MCNVFNFRPVGQGLFYSGSILDGEYKFVYDCGTENRLSYVKHEVDLFKKECAKKELEFVVLSHLHFDHYSGLKDLMANFKIKRIYLPYLSANSNLNELVLAYSTFVVKSDNEDDFDIKRSIFRFMRNLYVGDTASDSKIFIGRGDYEPESHSFFTYSYHNFHFSKHGQPYWNFILLNKKYNDAIIKNFENEVDALLLKYKVKSVRELVDNNKIDKIKEIYERVFGKGNNLNLTSTVLVHYPIEDKDCIIKQYEESLCCCKCALHKASITLLTGDAEVDRWEVAKLNSILNGKSGILQVPHHGSYSNWDSLDTVKDNFHLMVIPYGLGNKHKLPSVQTVDDILINRCAILYEVNQNRGLLYYLV